MRACAERMDRSPLLARLIHGAFWSVAGAVIGRGCGLLTWMVVARLVGRQVFGELGILQSTFAFLQNLGLFGLAVMATKCVAQYRSNEKDRAGRVVGLAILLSIGFGLVMGFVLVLLGPWIAARLLSAAHLGGLLRLGGFLVVLFSVSGVLEGALAGFEAFRPLAVLSFVGGILTLPLYAWGAWAGGLEGLVWAMIACALLTLALNYAVLDSIARKQGCGIRYVQILSEIKSFVGFSLPVYFSTQIFFGAEWLGNWMLIRQPSGYSEMGLYSAAARWQQAVSFVPMNIRRSLFPGLADRFEARDFRAFRSMLRHYTIWCTGIALACAVLLSFLSRLIMGGYGQGFAEGWIVLVVISVAMVLLPFRWVLEMIYRSTGLVRYEVVMNVIWAAALLLGMLELPGRGSLRLALSTVLASTLVALLGALHVRFLFSGLRWRPATPGPSGDSA